MRGGIGEHLGEISRLFHNTWNEVLRKDDLRIVTVGIYKLEGIWDTHTHTHMHAHAHTNTHTYTPLCRTRYPRAAVLNLSSVSESFGGFKNLLSLLFHQTNHIRLSGGRTQASAFQSSQDYNVAIKKRCVRAYL